MYVVPQSGVWGVYWVKSISYTWLNKRTRETNKICSRKLIRWNELFSEMRSEKINLGDPQRPQNGCQRKKVGTCGSEMTRDSCLANVAKGTKGRIRQI